MEPSPGGAPTDDSRDNTARSGLSAILTPAVVIAIVPGIGYVIAWVHEWALSWALNVPVELIAPQLSSVLVATGVLFLFLVFWMMVVDMYYALRKPGPLSPLEELVFRLAVSFGPALLFAVVRMVLGKWDGAVILGFLAFYAVSELILPAIRDREGTYRDRIRRYAERVFQRRSLVQLIPRYIGGFAAFRLLYGVYVLLTLTWILGLIQRDLQTDYMVTADTSTMAVTGIYGDTVVLAQFDPSTRKLNKTIEIRKLAPNGPLKLTWKRVGPLEASS